MSELNHKNIILGITGGIAAYKSALLTRLLITENANVRVCMTESATQFITPMTLQALSANPVHTDLFDQASEAAMGHIELARWADLIIIAPATANTLAKLATGQADNLLTTLCLATKAPIVVAPAMNQAMWSNRFTQENIRILQRHTSQQNSIHMHMIGPDAGSQACGDIGLGRMSEPETIIAELKQLFQRIQAPQDPEPLLAGINIIVTAGPTREAIDPVRYISNRSSGKMGYAIAAAAHRLGANVTLISGPAALDAPTGVTRHWVESADEMYQQVETHISNMDIFISTAAIADYAPQTVATKKIKKKTDSLTLELQKNIDVLATISHANPKLFTVGFAAETENVEDYARQKLINKKLNMIAANHVGKNKGFDVDENALTVIWQDGKQNLPLTSKTQLAENLMQLVSQHYRKFNDKH